ncbi:MAG: hypothetical protein ACK53L_07525, partial [Pirellulaceae bacterium]
MTKDVNAAVVEAKRKRISEDRLAAYNKPEADRDMEERRIAWEVESQIKPTLQELASPLPRAKQVEALEMIQKIKSLEAICKSTRSLKDQVNYAYWEMRAAAEQQETMVDARRLMFEGNALIDVADVKGAVDKFEAAWSRWDKVFRYYPKMMTEEVGEEVFK